MKAQKIARAAIIAAIYVVLCFMFAPFSYGILQVRISEALTLLPVLCPEAVIGVTIGCFLANVLSGSVIDMVVGTLATFLAALCTYKMRNMRFKGTVLPASIPPVLFNALIIGAELTILEMGLNSPLKVYIVNMASVGLGQIVSCCILGTLLILLIEKNKALRSLFNMA